jgi:hypothetical protein
MSAERLRLLERVGESARVQNSVTGIKILNEREFLSFRNFITNQLENVSYAF